LSGNRDRDAGGRARNARPRDRTGRPLPRDAAGSARASDDLVLEPAAALAEAERLIASGEPFAAHDVLEGVWKTRREGGCADAVTWQGLAQVAVGLTHLQRGNRVGAARLLERGAGNIGSGAVGEWAVELAQAVGGGEESVVHNLHDRRPSFIGSIAGF
jgi:hypothetical protein